MCRNLREKIFYRKLHVLKSTVKIPYFVYINNSVWYYVRIYMAETHVNCMFEYHADFSDLSQPEPNKYI
jgi:hypothetical protein